MDPDIRKFQQAMRETYYERDSARGKWQTVAWLLEEVGELSRAIRKGEKGHIEEEFGDVAAWLASLANLVGVELSDAIGKYAEGCPKCGAVPCRCPQPRG